MQVNTAARRRVSSQRHGRTPSAVCSFYPEPPKGEVTIEMFEDLGVKRLQGKTPRYI